MTFAAVIFDFDGVILESVDIKTRAFLELFADHPEHHAAIRRLHEENGGMSRYEKFRRIHAELLHRPLTDDDALALGDRFGAIVAREISTCPFVPGAQVFVERVSATMPCHIASGTPEDELRSIVSARGIDDHFDLVLGSPKPKAEIVERIVRHAGVPAESLVLIGDSIQDESAARAHGVAFIGRRGPGVAVPFGREALAVVSDLRELSERWDELAGPTMQYL